MIFPERWSTQYPDLEKAVNDLVAVQDDLVEFLDESEKEIELLHRSLVAEQEEWRDQQRRSQSELALEMAKLDQQKAELAAGTAESTHATELAARLEQTREELIEAKGEINRQQEEILRKTRLLEKFPRPEEVERKLRMLERERASLAQEASLLGAQLEAANRQNAAFLEMMRSRREAGACSEGNEDATPAEGDLNELAAQFDALRKEIG